MAENPVNDITNLTLNLKRDWKNKKIIKVSNQRYQNRFGVEEGEARSWQLTSFECTSRQTRVLRVGNKEICSKSQLVSLTTPNVLFQTIAF